MKVELRKHHHAVIAAVVGVFLMGAAGIFLPTHTVDAQVLSHDWARELKVEQFLARQYTDWIDNVPSDAYDETQFQAVRSYIQVYAGESCVEVGKVEDCTPHYNSLPVYGTKVNYTANRWGYERSIFARGISDPSDPTPDFTTCAELGCERFAGIVGTYTIHLQTGDQKFDCSVDNKHFGEYRVGDTYTLSMGLIARIPRCDSLARAGAS